MIPFHATNQDKYTQSLLDLLKTIHLYNSTTGLVRQNAAKLRDRALSFHNQDRAALGQTPLTISDFQIANKVIFKNN